MCFRKVNKFILKAERKDKRTKQQRNWFKIELSRNKCWTFCHVFVKGDDIFDLILPH